MKKALVGISVALMLLGMTGAASANLITNGDFSDGLNDWIVLNNDDFVIQSGGGAHVDYLEFLNSGAGQDGRLIQKFFIPTEATGVNVSFKWKSSFGQGGGENNDPAFEAFFSGLLNLDLNGAGLYNYANSEVLINTNVSTGWSDVGLTFLFGADVPTNVDPNARIRFEWDEGGDWISQAKLDDVVVEAIGVPEPTTLALLGLGLAGIGFQRRRLAA